MKKLFDCFDLKNIWILLFLVFFVSVPLFLLPEGCFAAIAICFLALFFVNKVEIKRFSLFIFFFSLLVRVLVVIAVPNPQYSDFLLNFEASQKMLQGDYSFLEMQYFQDWAYQMGIVFYQSVLLRIWNDVMILKLSNCLLSAFTCVLIYKIAGELTEKKASQGAALIYSLLPFTVFYPAILSNQYQSSFLIYLGLYVVVSKKIRLNTYVRYLIFGVLLALADVFRPESIIPLCATVLFLLLTIKKGGVKRNLINIAIVLASYYLLFNFISYLFKVTGISPLGLTNNDPLWKFVLGFNHETKGMWNLEDTILIETVSEMEIIKSRVLVPASQLIELFIEKIKIFWSGGGVEWTFYPFYESGMPFFGKSLRVSDDVDFMNSISKWMMIFSYFAVAVGSVHSLKKKNADPALLLIINQIFVTFGVYLLIEIQVRYIYFVQVSVLIAAATGFAVLSNTVRQLFLQSKE